MMGAPAILLEVPVMAAARACPTAEELRQLALGLLPEPLDEEYAAHLQQCPACEAALRGLVITDPLLDAVARLGQEASPRRTPTQFPAGGSVLQALADRLEVPRVRLRPAVTEAEAPVPRPDSPEMPPAAPRGAPACLQLLGEIARGGMGAILKGRDTDLGRDVAVKVLLETHAGRADLARRFVEEAQVGGQLQHPGIVPVYELGIFPDRRPYFTMKLVKGRTLAALLEARQDVAEDLPRFLGIFAQVCQTLAYAHARGVIHRDLKPANVMVGAFGEVQVMDWGLAKVLSSKDEGGRMKEESEKRPSDSSFILPPSSFKATEAGTLLGTPGYLAPEQARGDLGRVDERADVFGLGAILCEILTGAPPFVGKGGEQARKAQLARLDDAHGRLDGCGADPELIDLAKRCLAAEPGDRPRDAGQVADAVIAYQEAVAERLHRAELARAAEEARAIEARATAAQERKARRLTVALAAAVLLAVVLGGGGWLWLRAEREARLARTNQAVSAALAEARALRERARTAPAREATALAGQARQEAERAEALAESGPADAALAAQVRGLRAELDAEEKDRQLLAALDAARLAQVQSNDRGPGFAWGRAVPLFREAFRAYGMPAVETDPGEAAARLGRRPAEVRETALAALDEWLFMAEFPELQVQEPHRDWLRAVLAAAEPTGWAKEVRDAAQEKDPARRREALEKLAATADVRRLPARQLSLLGSRLLRLERGASAVVLLRRAQPWHADDVWVNLTLAEALYVQRADRTEVTRYLTAAVALRPDSSGARYDLGIALREQGRPLEAIVTLRRAIDLDPKNASAHALLAEMLRRQGKADADAAEYRQIIALDPKNAPAHANLGLILEGQGKADEALAEYRRAIEANPGLAAPHNNVGSILARQGRLEEAVAEFRQALACDPNQASAHANLGDAALVQGAWDEAAAEFRRALDLDPQLGQAHRGLGVVLLRQGRLAEARASLRRSLALLAQDEAQRSYAAAQLRQCESLLQLGPKLSEVLTGAVRPASADERVGYAVLCARTKRNAAAARLYAEAFAADPGMTDNPRTGHRYNAACAAALAGTGQGEDAGKLDEAERGHWRKQAVAWLRDDLAAFRKLLEDGRPEAQASVRNALRRWQHDPDVACLRDRDAVDKLPADEREACRHLWDDIEAILQKVPAAQGK
jgi:serine/threonine-protein kinase